MSCLQKPAEALDQDALKVAGGYTHTLVTALCLYLNDPSLAKMVAAIADLASSDSLFYLREPVSLTGKRLTLVQEFSEKIGDQYSAIYRTPEEYDALVSAHFDILDTQFLEGPAFHRHATTRHRYVVARVKQ